MVLFVLTACGGVARPAPHEPDRPQVAADAVPRLVEAERLYRAGDPAFAAARDALAADPATAYRLAQMLVRDVLFHLDNRDYDEAEFLKSAAKAENPKLDAAQAELRAMGAAAVPCIREELLMHRFADRRAIGIRLVTGLDAAASRALLPMLDSTDTRVRRTALEAMAGMTIDAATQARIQRMTNDPDFTVRGAAFVASTRAWPESVHTLRDALTAESDPFVRRVIVECMGGCRDRRSAEAVVEQFSRALHQGDLRSAESARRTLQQMSGLDYGTAISAWQGWARTLPER
jgi:hypothetical protein